MTTYFSFSINNIIYLFSRYRIELKAAAQFIFLFDLNISKYYFNLDIIYYLFNIIKNIKIILLLLFMIFFKFIKN